MSARNYRQLQLIRKTCSLARVCGEYISRPRRSLSVLAVESIKCWSFEESAVVAVVPIAVLTVLALAGIARSKKMCVMSR